MKGPSQAGIEYTQRRLNVERTVSLGAEIEAAFKAGYRWATAHKSYLKVINLKTLGRAGGKARAAKLSDTQRRAAAKKANRARWDKYYREHLEKIRPKKKRRAA